MAGSGHEDQFAGSQASDRYQSGEATFARTHSNGRDAPTADLTPVGWALSADIVVEPEASLLSQNHPGRTRENGYSALPSAAVIHPLPEARATALPAVDDITYRRCGPRSMFQVTLPQPSSCIRDGRQREIEVANLISSSQTAEFGNGRKAG